MVKITSKPSSVSRSSAQSGKMQIPSEFANLLNILKETANNSKYQTLSLKECPAPSLNSEFAIAISAQTPKATGRIVFIFSPTAFINQTEEKVKVVIFSEAAISDSQMFNKSLAKEIWEELKGETDKFKIVNCGISKTTDEYFATETKSEIERVNGIEINLSWFTSPKKELINKSFSVFTNIIMSMNKNHREKVTQKIS